MAGSASGQNLVPPAQRLPYSIRTPWYPVADGRPAGIG